MKTLLKCLAIAAAAGLTISAYAVPTLEISDGTNTVTIADAGLGDLNGLAGAVTYIGAVGGWSLNVSTGVSDTGMATMDLNSIDASAGAGTLTISFSDIDFTKTGSAFATIGGTTAGTVSYATYWDPNNKLFQLTDALTSQMFDSSPYSGSAASSELLGGTYSLTQVVTITHPGSGISSFDATLTVPDSGMTALLLGLGLLGMGVFARQRRVARE